MRVDDHSTNGTMLNGAPRQLLCLCVAFLQRIDTMHAHAMVQRRFQRGTQCHRRRYECEWPRTALFVCRRTRRQRLKRQTTRRGRGKRVHAARVQCRTPSRPRLHQDTDTHIAVSCIGCRVVTMAGENRRRSSLRVPGVASCRRSSRRGGGTDPDAHFDRRAGSQCADRRQRGEKRTRRAGAHVRARAPLSPLPGLPTPPTCRYRRACSVALPVPLRTSCIKYDTRSVRAFVFCGGRPVAAALSANATVPSPALPRVTVQRGLFEFFRPSPSASGSGAAKRAAQAPATGTDAKRARADVTSTARRLDTAEAVAAAATGRAGSRVLKRIGLARADATGDDTAAWRVTNKRFIELLLELSRSEKDGGDKMRAMAYLKAVNAIRDHNAPIASGKEAMRLPGVGKKIGAKFDEMLATGKLARIERDREDPRNVALAQMTSIANIGPVLARQLVDQRGIMSIAQLQDAVDARRVVLTKAQLVGLKYAPEFAQRIPRAEMELLRAEVVAAATCVDSRITVEVLGSFRRGAASSGDIDVILGHPLFSSSSGGGRPAASFVRLVAAQLKRGGFIIDDLVSGDVKYMGVCRLRRSPGSAAAAPRAPAVRLPNHAPPRSNACA